MNWQAELIEDCREDDGALHPQTDHVLSGAHWMLRRLRTDEAVERAARDLYVHSTVGATEKTWDLGSLIPKDAWRLKARAAITALLGEDA